MDVVVTGRHQQLSESFKGHVTERLDKIEQLAPRALRVEVLVSHEPNRRQAKATERVEITCHVRGPVIRAEASHDDKYAAFEMAMDKLVERLRRASDRRRVNRGRGADTIRVMASPVAGAETRGDVVEPGDTDLFGAVGDSPIEVREKIHQSLPMTLEDALRQMELVGHDFFLFHDVETGKPSVVYRRRGWAYGVIHLDVAEVAVT